MNHLVKNMKKVLEEIDVNAERCCEMISDKFGELIEKMKEREKELKEKVKELRNVEKKEVQIQKR